MMNAEMVHRKIVSKYTPKAWVRPCLTGCDTEAVAPAFGAEPMPPSLENMPRRTPIMTTVPSEAPANCSIPNAELKMSDNAPGIWSALTMTTAVPRAGTPAP